MTEKHTVNERAALYGNHLAIIVKLSVKRLRIQWKLRHRHRRVCHAIRIDNETCDGSDTVNEFQTAPYLRAHLAALEHGNVSLDRHRSYFAFAAAPSGHDAHAGRVG